MDCCDYIWFTSHPISAQAQQQQQQPSASSQTPSPQQQQRQQRISSSQQQQFELRPVAVLQPPDGMQLPKGLPSKCLGSDHICLLADFELVCRPPAAGRR